MSNRINQEEFVRRVIERWGEGRWDLSLSHYEGINVHLYVRCLVHGGVCRTTPKTLWRGQNPCDSCISTNRHIKFGVGDFIRLLARQWAPCRWIFVESDFCDLDTPMKVICRLHNFSTIVKPLTLVNGYNPCFLCRTMKQSHQLSQEEFVRRVYERWGSEHWDLSEAVYKGIETYLSVRCILHDSYCQTNPKMLWRGQSPCKECPSLMKKDTQSRQSCSTLKQNNLGQKEFVRRVYQRWGENRWGLEYAVYRGVNTHIYVTCRIHQLSCRTTPKTLWRGQNPCNVCRPSPKHSSVDTKVIIGELRLMWGHEQWDIPHIEYCDLDTPINVTCRIHGLSISVKPVILLSGFNPCIQCQPAKDESALTKRTAPRLTQQDFVDRVFDMWGEDHWDLSEAVYRGVDTHLNVRCLFHGDVCRTTPKTLWRGQNPCKKCRARGVRPRNQCIKRVVEQPLPTSHREFSQQVREVWGEGRWDLSRVRYMSPVKPVSVTCLLHNIPARISPQSLLAQKNPCAECRQTEQDKADE